MCARDSIISPRPVRCFRVRHHDILVELGAKVVSVVAINESRGRYAQRRLNPSLYMYIGGGKMSTPVDSIDISQLKAQVLGLDVTVSEPKRLQCLQ